jgi:hypothetical protein
LECFDLSKLWLYDGLCAYARVLYLLGYSCGVIAAAALVRGE